MISIKKRLKDFLLFDSEILKITFTKNKLHIINFEEIKNFDDNKIIIADSTNTITIKGKNLSTRKLLDNEILVEGEIISIEFR